VLNQLRVQDGTGTAPPTAPKDIIQVAHADTLREQENKEIQPSDFQAALAEKIQDPEKQSMSARIRGYLQVAGEIQQMMPGPLGMHARMLATDKIMANAGQTMAGPSPTMGAMQAMSGAIGQGARALGSGPGPSGLLNAILTGLDRSIIDFAAQTANAANDLGRLGDANLTGLTSIGTEKGYKKAAAEQLIPELIRPQEGVPSTAERWMSAAQGKMQGIYPAGAPMPMLREERLGRGVPQEGGGEAPARPKDLFKSPIVTRTMYAFVDEAKFTDQIRKTIKGVPPSGQEQAYMDGFEKAIDHIYDTWPRVLTFLGADLPVYIATDPMTPFTPGGNVAGRGARATAPIMQKAAQELAEAGLKEIIHPIEAVKMAMSPGVQAAKAVNYVISNRWVKDAQTGHYKLVPNQAEALRGKILLDPRIQHLGIFNGPPTPANDYLLPMVDRHIAENIKRNVEPAKRTIADELVVGSHELLLKAVPEPNLSFTMKERIAKAMGAKAETQIQEMADVYGQDVADMVQRQIAEAAGNSIEADIRYYLDTPTVNHKGILRTTKADFQDQLKGIRKELKNRQTQTNQYTTDQQRAVKREYMFNQRMGAKVAAQGGVQTSVGHSDPIHQALAELQDPLAEQYLAAIKQQTMGPPTDDLTQEYVNTLRNQFIGTNTLRADAAADQYRRSQGQMAIERLAQEYIDNLKGQAVFPDGQTSMVNWIREPQRVIPQVYEVAHYAQAKFNVELDRSLKEFFHPQTGVLAKAGIKRKDARSKAVFDYLDTPYKLREDGTRSMSEAKKYAFEQLNPKAKIAAQQIETFFETAAKRLGIKDTDHYIQGYANHIWPKEEFSKGLPLELFNIRVNKNVMFQHILKREERGDYIHDIHDALQSYLVGYNRKIYMQPLFDNMANQAKLFQAAGQPEKAQYTMRLMDQLMGRPGALEAIANETFRYNPLYTAGTWVADTLVNSIYHGFLTGNLGYITKNLISGSLNTASDSGPMAMFAGLGALATPKGRQMAKEIKLGNQFAAVNDYKIGPRHRFRNVIENISGFSENLNRGTAVMTGLADFADTKGLRVADLQRDPELFAEAVNHAIRTAEETQYVYGKLGRSPLLASMVGGTASNAAMQFQSYYLKHGEFILSKMHSDYGVVLNTLIYAGVAQRVLSGELGIDATQFTGTGALMPNQRIGQLPFSSPAFGAIQHLHKALTGTAEEQRRAWPGFLESVKASIPGYVAVVAKGAKGKEAMEEHIRTIEGRVFLQELTPKEMAGGWPRALAQLPLNSTGELRRGNERLRNDQARSRIATDEAKRWAAEAQEIEAMEAEYIAMGKTLEKGDRQKLIEATMRFNAIAQNNFTTIDQAINAQQSVAKARELTQFGRALLADKPAAHRSGAYYSLERSSVKPFRTRSQARGDSSRGGY